MVNLTREQSEIIEHRRTLAIDALELALGQAKAGRWEKALDPMQVAQTQILALASYPYSSLTPTNGAHQ